MAVSVSGILTLLGLIFCGPLYYGLEWLYKRVRGTEIDSAPSSSTSTSPSSTTSTKTTTSTNKKLSSFSTPQEEEEEETTEVMTLALPAQTIHEDDQRTTMHSYTYLLSLIGYAISIGNVWRFPYVISQNGGAAALLAYICCATMVAVPLFLYEMIVGQHTRLSTIRCYEMIRPKWKSLGYAAGVMLFLILAYYGMIIAYTLPYIYYSLHDPLPWLQDGAESFWFETILNSYPTLEAKPTLGPIQGGLVTSLLLLWAIVFLTAGFGKDILAKVTTVTVILPVALMAVLILRSIFLEGAYDGLHFYLGTFKFAQLRSMKVWAAACGQIIFSLSPGFGTAITYSSFAKPKEDVYRTCLIVAVTNSSFSIFSGLATFSLVGHLAFKAGVPVEQIATRGGTGLAFITMAEAMEYFGPFANVFSVMFFSTLFMLGLNSVYAWLETLVSYVNDFAEEQGWPIRPTWQTSLYLIALLILIGLPFTTRLGIETIDVMDHFVGTIFLLLVAFVESIMFITDFGWDRMNFALKVATCGNPSTPNGRTLAPTWLCRADFFMTVPALTGLLGLYLIHLDFNEVYGGYPFSLVSWGYGLLVALICIIPLTLWKQDPSMLPAITNATMKEVDATMALALAHAKETDDFSDEFRNIEAPSITVTPAESAEKPKQPTALSHDL